MTKPKCLVTGGAGFIGSNLSNFLYEIGWELDIVDDLSNGRKDFLSVDLRSERLWVDDFASPEVLSKIHSKYYDYVFHLAANPRVGFSVSNPVASNDVNVTKSLLLIDACKGNIKRFIFASSSAIYGNAQVLPVKESSPINPQSPYALQKYVIEEYLKLYYGLFGLESVCLRFFNVYGPNQLGSSPYSTAVSAWLTALYNDSPLRSDGDGTQTRDMIYVQDVVKALVKSAIISQPSGSEIFNIGTGSSISNNQILEMIKYRYPKVSIYNAPERQGDVKHTLSSIEKANEFIGFNPSYDFVHGLIETIKWYDENWEGLKSTL